MLKLIKIFITSLFLFSAFLVQHSFAQELQLDNDSVRIYLGNNRLNAEILNESPSQDSSLVEISLVNDETSPPSFENIGNIDWAVGTISLTLDPSDPSYGVYSRLLFSYSENEDSGNPLSIEFNIEDILNEGDSPPITQNPNNPPNEDTPPTLTLNFPDWQHIPTPSRFKLIPNSDGKYHPVLKSNQTVNGDTTITRTPSDVPIYLVIENTNEALPTDQRFGVLELIPEGSSSFNINFLTSTEIDISDIPPAAYLDPGQTYAVFLSADFSPDVEPVALSGTRSVLPMVPSATTNQNEIVSNIIATPKQQGGKRYYEITGTITAPIPAPAAGTTLDFVIVPSGETSGQVLAQVPYVSGLLPTIPNNQALANFTSLATGSYQLSIKSSFDNQEIQSPKILPAMTLNPSGTNSASINNTQIFTPEQRALLGGGIVPDCGYNLGGDGNGRICGFNDLIGLIQEVIEYIFILTVPITAIVFAYAGFLYITSGEKPKKREDAKNAMIKVVIGIAVVMSAWLVVTLIVTTLGATTATTQFLDL
jgi:hypothetical protein